MDTPELPPLWQHQSQAILDCAAAYRHGHRSIAITSPTGGGKSRIMAELSVRASAKGKRVGIFSNRKILTGQMTATLDRAGVTHGVIAAGYESNSLWDVQVCSVQTLNARALKAAKFPLPAFDVVMFDEAHGATSGVALDLITHYKESGALIFLPTATPVGLGRLHEVNGKKEPIATTMVVAGTNSEMRACGALVPCHVFAPDEPSMKGVKRTKVGEYEHKGMVKAVMDTLVFANVFDHWQTLNPFHAPTLLWAPGVPESRWFAAQFEQRGIKAAHLDGATADAERVRIFEQSQAGEIQVICSFGVLREGADLPWIRHGILTQPCCLLRTYLQIVGRLLRASPGKADCILQDHAGAFHRHGSPNADRVWQLKDTDKSVSKRAAGVTGEKPPPEPIRCPQCSGIRAGGPRCPHCGHEHKMSVRMVRMTDGTLKRVVGNVNKKKNVADDPQRLWNQCLHAAAYSRRTVGQAAADFRRRSNGGSPFNLQPCPPAGSADWKLLAGDVYPHLLKRKGQAHVV